MTREEGVSGGLAGVRRESRRRRVERKRDWDFEGVQSMHGKVLKSTRKLACTWPGLDPCT